MTINDLVQGFAKHITSLKGKDYKESQVRLHYIDPFWKLLGWDVSNDEQKAPQDVDVLIEPSMDSAEEDGLKSREPDYLFRLNGFPRFIVEAKRPIVDLDTDRPAIFQTKRYAWNATIPFAILTDFEQFRLYDTTLRPILNEPNRGLVREFSIDFQNYPAVWEEIIANFSRDAVADGSLEKLRAKIRKVPAGRRIRTVDRMLFDLRGDEPVDREFLGYLEKYRKQFARAIYHDNKKEFPEANTLHGAARLTEAVQRLIDRMIFMRVCEDRGVSKYGQLRDDLSRVSAEGGNFYHSLREDFRTLDREYNGYLFKFHFSEELSVNDDILADFVRTLYPPDGPWDFSAISDDILGIVYERFLGHTVTIKSNNADIEEKPEVRHAGGVYYTPRFVVDTIIRRVVGPQIEGKKPLEVMDVKVLDPACGSGSFLVAAFQYLIDHCLAAIAADPSLAKVPATPKSRKKHKEIAFKNSKGIWHLAPDFKAALLTNCIHGVDIDQQAVEVTVMSLYLKMLEGQLPPHWQREWLENQLLPTLDNNIHCGNSLIDSVQFDKYIVEELGNLFPEDDDIRFRINRFDWTSRTRGFGKILLFNEMKERRRAGFDCIIGNPPYIRVQELNKWAPDECEFYKWRYKSAEKGNYDIYVVFTERCLELLSPNGLLGFIMPHKFWQAKYGEGLRKIIAEGRHLSSIFDFGHQQVFQGASTYTAISILQKLPNKSAEVQMIEVDHLYDGPAQLVAAHEGKAIQGVNYFAARQPSDGDAWSFAAPNQANLLDNIRLATSLTLENVTERMAQGIRTSMNPVYVLEKAGRSSGSYISDKLQQEIKLEPELIRPFLAAENIRRYEITPSNKVVLIPYDCRKSQSGELYTESKLKSELPNTWKYLKSCEVDLRQRENGRMNREGWYGFIYPKNLSLIDVPKILVPDIVEAPSFALDRKGGTAFVSGYAITIPKKTTIELAYLVGLLNSQLLGAFLKSVSTALRGGWYRPFPQFMKQIPIKEPGTASEKKLADSIIESVETIMEAKAKLRSGKLSDRDQGTYEKQVEHHEQRIDEAVFQLYGVDGLPK